MTDFPADIEWLKIPDLVEQLGISPGRISKLVENRELLWIVREGVKQMPANFVLDGAPVTGLRGTIIVLLDAGASEEEAVEWLVSDNDAMGERPIDALRRGNKAAVRRNALLAMA